MLLKPVLNHPAQQLNTAFQALADPTRRAMIEQLSQGAHSVSDLAAPLSITLPAVMQHLAILETAGLVVSEKHGRVRICRIEPKAFSQVEAWIQARRTEWQHRLDRLGAYLNQIQAKDGCDDPGS